MAAPALDASLAEIISSLDLDKVPDKLHCAACHRFLFNAYKPTCCEQYICEPCFTGAQGSCPICDHKPFSEEICKPNKAMRGTAKAYLRTVEKKVDDRSKAPSTEPPRAQTPERKDQMNGDVAVDGNRPDDAQSPPPLEQGHEMKGITVDERRPSLEAADESQKPTSADSTTDAADDEVEIQVEPSSPEEQETPKVMNVDVGTMEPTSGANLHEGGAATNPQDHSDAIAPGMDGANFANMMNMGFNTMDYNQMMQMMAATSGMNGFNPMMGMPMGMNPMSAGMFGGGFGGPNGGMNGMNGMNMGMSFNPGQGMFAGWNGQSNTMWQNNNANAFANGMGGDFGSTFGFNMAHQGNFQQQQYPPNGDFQLGYHGRGYGRSRGRGRGGYGRGRGNFHQFSPNEQAMFQRAPDQHQYEFQNMSDAHVDDQQDTAHPDHDVAARTETTEPSQEDDEFAPGGQEEVQEALGDDYEKAKAGEETAQQTVDATEAVPPQSHPSDQRDRGSEDQPAAVNGNTEKVEIMRVPSPKAYDDDEHSGNVPSKPVPEAYQEDLQGPPMPPPSAPLGPAAQYGDAVKDYGFRSRGHGRFSSRGRGSGPMPQHIYPTSPVKPAPTLQPVNSPEPKGVGVVGAPTGPRAMREPPIKPAAPRSSGGGFQIVGRASMVSQIGQPRATVKTRSPSPANDNNEYRDQDDRSYSRRQSRHERRDSARYEAEEQDDEYRAHDRDRDRDRDRRRRRSKRDDYADDDDNQNPSSSRPGSVDRKSAHRSRRDKDREGKEKYSGSSSKHYSSRARRYHDDNGNGDSAMDDYSGEPAAQSTRDKDTFDAESRSSRHDRPGSKLSRYDERDRDREHRDKDRKRSRHDRDREDEYYGDDGGGGGYQESRHRSRRHKKDHHREDASTMTNGALHHRSSEATTSAAPAPAPVEAEKDPHTLEREARNRERMLKEQQRREKADKRSGGGGHRRVSYKYEDEAERGMVESEKATARWR